MENFGGHKESMVNECEQLLLERTEILNYVQRNFEELSKRADTAPIIKFGTKCDLLGQFCPSIITFKRDKKMKKGKFLKEKAEGIPYTVYEMNEDKTPIRLRKYNQYGCDLTCYFYNRNDFSYAVPLFRETKSDYKTYIYKYLIQKGRILECAKIENCHVVFEKYNYSHFEEGYFECDWCYYYNSSFSRISSSLVEMVTKKIEQEKLNIPSDDKCTIRISRYYYKIFVKDSKVHYIEEYVRNADELKYVRTLW